MKKFLIATGVAVLAFASVAGAQTATFTSNLTIGSTGAEVVALQTALINGGFNIPAIASGAAAKGYFGSQTQTAVKAYQASKGVPSTGFVGPLTRAALNGAPASSGSASVSCPVGFTCTAVGGSTGSVGSSEGLLKSFNQSGDVESDLDEGDSDARVVGVEFEADQSDMKIERVDVVFDNADDASSPRITRYFSNISLWLDGKKIAEAPASAATKEDDGSYSLRATGLNAVVKDGKTAELFVAVDVVDSIDADDETADWLITIPKFGIRAVDTAGISDTYPPTTDYNESVSVGEASTGEIDLSLSNSNPTAKDVRVNDTEDTTVDALVFELEANNQDVTITSIPVLLTTTGATTSAMVRNLKLYNGSTLLDTVTVSSANSTTSAIFDVDLDISEDDSVDLKVVATVKPLEDDSTNFTEGDSFNVSISGDDVDAEDSNGDDATVDGDATGKEMTLRTEGLALTLVSATASVVSGGETGDDSGTFTIVFEAKAFGVATYVGATSTEDTAPFNTTANGAAYSITNPGSNTTTSFLDAEGSEDLDGGGVYYIPKNETRKFTLEVSAVATSTAFAQVKLEAVAWGTTSAVDQLYTSNLDNYKTSAKNLIAR